MNKERVQAALDAIDQIRTPSGIAGAIREGILELQIECSRLHDIAYPKSVTVEDVTFPPALDTPECRQALASGRVH